MRISGKKNIRSSEEVFPYRGHRDVFSPTKGLRGTVGSSTGTVTKNVGRKRPTGTRSSVTLGVHDGLLTGKTLPSTTTQDSKDQHKIPPTPLLGKNPENENLCVYVLSWCS